MKCCGQDMVEVDGPVTIDYNFIGDTLTVNGIHTLCLICSKCYYGLDLCRKIDAKIQTFQEDWILAQPIRDFLSAAQTAKELNMGQSTLSKKLNEIRKKYEQYIA